MPLFWLMAFALAWGLTAPAALSARGVIESLERANLVRRWREGREHILAFNPAPLDRAARWIEEQRGAWTARLEALDKALKAQDRAAKPKRPRQ